MGSRINPPCLNRISAITMESTKSSLLANGKPATSSTSSSAQRVAGTQHSPEATISVTEFKRANLSPEPLCGVNSDTGSPIRRISWYIATPELFFSTINASGSQASYSSMHISLSSGNSILLFILFKSMRLYASVSSFIKTPHVVSAV